MSTSITLAGIAAALISVLVIWHVKRTVRKSIFDTLKEFIEELKNWR